MTFTEQYTRLHQAFQEAAAALSLTPFEVRMVVALSEFGGSATTLEVEEALGVHGSAVRRSYVTLRDLGYVTASAASGGPVKRGTRARLTLTQYGHRLAEAVTDNIDAEEARAA